MGLIKLLPRMPLRGDYAPMRNTGVASSVWGCIELLTFGPFPCGLSLPTLPCAHAFDERMQPTLQENSKMGVLLN